MVQECVCINIIDRENGVDSEHTTLYIGRLYICDQIAF